MIRIDMFCRYEEPWSARFQVWQTRSNKYAWRYSEREGLQFLFVNVGGVNATASIYQAALRLISGLSSSLTYIGAAVGLLA